MVGSGRNLFLPPQRIQPLNHQICGRTQETAIAQLRSLNSQLEREVVDMEEERRRLKWELKFRAKYHGKAALDMGLSPEQLLLVEQYTDAIRHGGPKAPHEVGF